MSGFAPTDEQLEALELFRGGSSVAIEAFAGAGKTSTLKLLAEATPRSGQYVAFNKAIATEAGAKMPGTVRASTAHALAFRETPQAFRARLDARKRMRSAELARLLRIDPLLVTTESGKRSLSPSYLAGVVMRAVRGFCQSADLEPGEQHFPYLKGLDVPQVEGDKIRPGWAVNREVRAHLLPVLQRAWRDLADPNGGLPYDHDHYLKRWHLSGPRIEADVVYFDEAQDANPVLVDIVARQSHAQLVWVGDSYQQIYTFTGAVNALAGVPADARAYLSQSWRFGFEVAEVADRILTDLGAPKHLRGNPSIASVVAPCPEPDAVLARTNATTVRELIARLADGARAHLVGGGTEVAAFAAGAAALQQGGYTDHPDLACFTTWAEVVHYVEHDELGDELRLLVKLVEDFTPGALLDALERIVPEASADVVISTAHKAKGREWPAVRLAGDFPSDLDPLDPDSHEELRLLYVAATRAQQQLDVTAVPLLDDQPDREVLFS